MFKTEKISRAVLCSHLLIVICWQYFDSWPSSALILGELQKPLSYWISRDIFWKILLKGHFSFFTLWSSFPPLNTCLKITFSPHWFIGSGTGTNAASPSSRQKISHNLMLTTSSLPKLFYTLLSSTRANLMSLNKPGSSCPRCKYRRQ